MKLNTYASWKGKLGENGKAGCVGRIRNERAAWVKGFLEDCLIALSWNLSCGQSLEGLCWWRRKELILCMEVETDSQGVVQIIQDGPHGRVPSRNIIRDCWLFMRQWNARVTFVPREDNQCAGFLAKMGVSLWFFFKTLLKLWGGFWMKTERVWSWWTSFCFCFFPPFVCCVLLTFRWIKTGCFDS